MSTQPSGPPVRPPMRGDPDPPQPAFSEPAAPAQEEEPVEGETE